MDVRSEVAAAVGERRRGWLGGLLAVVLGVVAVAAVYGGVGLIRDGMGMPADWAGRLPLHSWVVAGLALLVGVAAPQGIACGSVLVGDPRAAIGAAAAGAVLVGWIVVEVLVLREYSVLQPVIAVLGLLELALAWWWLSAIPVAPPGRSASPSRGATG